MSFEEQQEAVWRVALASYDPREMRVWMRYLEECNPAIRCTGYRTSQTAPYWGEAMAIVEAGTEGCVTLQADSIVGSAVAAVQVHKE